MIWEGRYSQWRRGDAEKSGAAHERERGEWEQGARKHRSVSILADDHFGDTV
jgi:hypothetical protein